MKDLWHEINKVEVLNGAAVMAFFSMLAIFPAAILGLTLLPYLGIPNLDRTILAALYQAIPEQAAELLATIWLLMLSALSLFYYYGPDIRQHYRLITPGALLATFLFITSSMGFRLYVAHFASYEATYGSLGAVIVLLMWLYVGGLVVLIGSEVNGLLEGYCYRTKAAKAKRSRLKA